MYELFATKEVKLIRSLARPSHTYKTMKTHFTHTTADILLRTLAGLKDAIRGQ